MQPVILQDWVQHVWWFVCRATPLSVRRSMSRARLAASFVAYLVDTTVYVPSAGGNGTIVVVGSFDASVHVCGNRPLLHAHTCARALTHRGCRTRSEARKLCTQLTHLRETPRVVRSLSH